MANTNSPMGLRAVRHFSGGVMRPAEYTIADGYNTAIYAGDLVKSTGTGNNIAVCAAGERAIGVFDGVSLTDAAGTITWQRHWTASTALATGVRAKAFVYDDPRILFSVQVSGSAGLVATDIHNFADIVYAAGNVSSGNSGVMLDQGTLTATTATGGQLFIYRLEPTLGNAYGQYAKALVMINEHELAGSTTAGNQFNAV